MTLLKELKECSNMIEAEPILEKLNAGRAATKLVETAMIMSNSKDRQQRDYAYTLVKEAVEDIKDDIKDKKTKDDDEHEIHEEELDNHNNGPREKGSEQSTQNKEPYSGEGKDSTDGEKAAQDITDPENQFNEGMPGQMPPIPGMTPGLAPDVAAEMGAGMPELPQMNSNQMMRQMQYTVREVINEYHKKHITPMIRNLEKQIKESVKNNITFDMDELREKAPARIRETESTDPMFAVQKRTTINRENLSDTRSEISQMNKILNR